jgi:hypothetical protein
MSRRPGRPPTDRLDLLERTVAVLLAEPWLAAHPGVLRERVRAREADVRRVLRSLRAISRVDLPAPTLGRPKKGGPNSGSGVSRSGR